jgi:hypothetical protein
VVPTLPHEAITVDVVYPTVLLAHGRPLGLLPAMVSCIQSGLRSLTTQFCNVIVEVDGFGEDVLDRNGDPKRITPKPRVELLYTYLVTWYIMHCPALMSAIPSYEVNVPFVHKLESSTWLVNYSAAIRRTIQSSANYHLF